MKRNVAWLLLGAVLLVLLLHGIPRFHVRRPQANPPDTPGNIVLVVIDALRADRLGARRNGVQLMPNLGRVAEESWRFTNAVSQGSWTKPSVVSILTSLYPAVHGVQYGVAEKILEAQDMTIDVLPEDIETAATYFKKRGYKTVCIQTNRHLAAPFGFGQGFDRYELMDDAPADRVTSAAIDAVHEAGERFFLYVHYMDPHAPYEPPEHYRALFGGPPPIAEQDRKLLTDYNGYYVDRVLNDLNLQSERKHPDFSASGREHVQYLYDGEVKFADDELGGLIARIRGDFPDTVFVVTSDHGEEFWDHGSIGHSKTVYQELTHVPLVIYLPGRPPRTVATPVETIDILPTLAAYLGFAPNPDWQGRSLIDLEEDEPAPQTPVFSETNGSIREANLHIESVIQGPTKLLEDKRTSTQVLYDLAQDPAEQRDIAQSEPQTVKRLLEILEQHHAANLQHPKHSTTPKTTTLDEQTLQRLKSLGY